MNPHHVKLLALVRRGMHDSAEMAAETTLSLRKVRETLRSLKDAGLIVSLRVERTGWVWVSAEVADEVRAAIALHAGILAREAWARENARRSRARRLDRMVRAARSSLPRSVFDVGATI